jgi:hypothetical protein
MGFDRNACIEAFLICDKVSWWVAWMCARTPVWWQPGEADMGGHGFRLASPA